MKAREFTVRYGFYLRKMDNDTICAPASAPVQSALAIIRISGPQSYEIIQKYFSNPEKIGHQRCAYGHIIDNDTKIDDVIVTYYKAPYSFTGEDVVEISCHGNPLIVQNILSLLQKDNSSRMAGPGEFTRRAFENGKMDLTAAEAVNAIINARSEWEIDTALNQMHGSLRKEVETIKEKLITLKADIEAAIDFSHENIQFVSHEEILHSISMLTEQINDIKKRCSVGEKIIQGLTIAIIGKPNAGKSSILNYIVNEERAIVSDIPGTTRDLVRETIQINGIHINLIDTAGIRKSDDTVEKIGIDRSREAVVKANIVLTVLDCTTGITDEDRDILSIVPEKDVIFLLNKVDITGTDIEYLFKEIDGTKIKFSAVTGEGFSLLENTIASLMMKGIEKYENSFIADSRIISILENSVNLCHTVYESVENGNPEEIVAADIQSLLDTVKEITGEVSPDEVLHSIFDRFCIGK